MNFTNQLFLNQIKNLSLNYESLKVINSNETESTQRIIEQSSMNLKRLELSYLRSPCILKSFKEGNLKPVIFADADIQNFTASFSECSLMINNIKSDSYYSSDLRSSKSTSIKTRKDFRSLYSNVISSLPKDSICFTAILSSNKKALNALTRINQYYNYNLLFNYKSISSIFTPLDLISRLNIKIIEVNSSTTEKLRDAFIKKQSNDLSFSHSIITSSERKTQKDFLIVKKDKVTSYFSVYSPQFRQIEIKSKNTIFNFLIKLITKGTNRLRWVYITNYLTINDRCIELAQIKKYLYGKSIISNFNILLFSTTLCIRKLPHLSVITKGKIFRVESEKRDRALKGRTMINPLCL